MDQAYNSSVDRGPLHSHVGGAVPAANFPCYDGNGNITTLVSTADGAVSATYDYSPFGLTVSKSGPDADANTYRFSTKQQDETGLYYYGFRYYNPTLGRWMNRDPMAEFANTAATSGILPVRVYPNLRSDMAQYSMLGNNPVTEIDYLGLKQDFGWFICRAICTAACTFITDCPIP
jgi:RHS repeat-associated protein